MNAASVFERPAPEDRRDGGIRHVVPTDSWAVQGQRQLVIKLLQRVRATGDVSPAQFGGYKVSPLAAHEADLRRWVAERSEITIVELQALLLERGTRTSPAALARFLGKLGLTRKKRRREPPSRRARTSPRPAASGSDGSAG